MFICDVNNGRERYKKNGYITEDDIYLNVILEFQDSCRIHFDEGICRWVRYNDDYKNIKDEINVFHQNSNAMFEGKYTKECLQIEKHRLKDYDDTFCVSMSIDEMIEIIFKFYQENPQILLQEIFESEDYDLCNVMDEYRFLEMTTSFVRNLVECEHKLIICNKDLPIEFDYKHVEYDETNE
jgi:hypothetical protein